MCTWPTKFCTSIWASLQGKRSHSRSSRVCNLEPKASLSVKPLMWPQSRQLQESPMAQRSWRDAPRLGEQWACQRHSMGLKRHSFTVWTSGANEQSFLRLWYNTSLDPQTSTWPGTTIKMSAWMWVVAYIISMHVLQVELNLNLGWSLSQSNVTTQEHLWSHAAGSACRLVWKRFYSRFWSSRHTPTHWLVTRDMERKDDPSSAANTLNTWHVEGNEE